MTTPSRHRSRPVSRREIFRLGVGLGVTALWPANGLAAGRIGLRRLKLRYRTDPERIARALPAPLEPGDRAEVFVEYAVAEQVGEASSARVEGSGILVPPSFGWSGIYLSARYENTSGLLPVGLWTSDEWGRIHAREAAGIPFKPGNISVERQDGRIQAAVQTRNHALHRADTLLTDRAAPAPDLSSGGGGIFAFRYRLHPNWAEALFSDDHVELWLVENLVRNSPAEGATEETGSPVETTSASRREVFARGCDLKHTTFQWLEASVLDPAVEFPALELLEAWYEEPEAPASGALPGPASQQYSRLQARIPQEEFQPWTLLNYERPGRDGKPWVPAGWRQASTAYRLSPEDLKAYRERKEIQLTEVDLVDIHLAIEREALAEMLPAELQPGARLRLLALRVNSSDLSPQPFHELWLLAHGLLGREHVWYALSHIVGPGGDVTLGRETFGYPSKRGHIEIVNTQVDFTVLGQRHGRDFVYGEGAFQGFSTGTSLLEMQVVGLRAGPFGGETARGELVLQPWYFQGQRSYVERESIRVELPGERGAGENAADPWFEFNPFDVLAVSALHHGSLQRAPGKVVAEVSEVGPFYRERCDGLLPAETPPLQTPPTFRVKRPAETRSLLFPHQV